MEAGGRRDAGGSPATERHRSRADVARRLARAVALLVGLVLAAPAEAGESALPVRDVAGAIRGEIPGPDVQAYLGVAVDATAAGVRVVRVVPGSPAEDAGLRASDLLREVDGRALAVPGDVDAVLTARRPGETVRVVAWRAAAIVDTRVRLGGRRGADTLFRKSVFRLAAVPLRFSDDAESTPAAETLRRLLFARSAATGAGASLADYYRGQSFGRLAVEGDVFEPLTLRAPRSRYAALPMGAGEGSAFQEAADDLLRSRGASALDGFDGVVFLYAGESESRAGFALWPHRAVVMVGARKLPYYVHGAGAKDGAAIGIHCHEFGHLLGLADEYGAGHRTGSGDFCLMALGHRGGEVSGAASPFSICVHCRMKLGWISPAVVDPRTRQRLRIRPVATAADQAVLIPLDGRCSQYVILEVRARRGSDAEFPSEGLLVWHVGGRPTPGQGIYAPPVDLVEAHGVDVFDASLVRTHEVAFPTDRARDITPDTQPAIVPATRASFPLHLTDIVRESDGSVLVTIGVARRVVQPAPAPSEPETPDADGCVVRRDPVTGEETRFRVGAGQVAPPALPPAPSSGQR